jgi:glycosyltransferase involved in cell wall biosynthesis
MRLCIDGSNLRQGGGVTHIKELLAQADIAVHGFDRIYIWAPRATLAQLVEHPWLVKRTEPVLESNPLRRALWQRYRLGALARADGCALIFVPGGTFTTPFRPIVTMCRNMLPFEWREMRRYGVSLQGMRLLMLRFAQARSFRRASGMIFLTHYAREVVDRQVGRLEGPMQIIPHGVDARFFAPIRRAMSTEPRPLEIVYVSIIDHYKHQVPVSKAVVRLAAEGHPLRLTLIGPSYPPAMKHLRSMLDRLDPDGSIVRYLGPMAHEEIHAVYERADVGLFASSCENMPNILLEEMAAGLPIACSDRGPMPEILRGAGEFFDPEDVSSIAEAILRLIRDPGLRERRARAAQALAREYSWPRCADETFRFLSRIATAHGANVEAGTAG